MLGLSPCIRKHGAGQERGLWEFLRQQLRQWSAGDPTHTNHTTRPSCRMQVHCLPCTFASRGGWVAAGGRTQQARGCADSTSRGVFDTRGAPPDSVSRVPRQFDARAAACAGGVSSRAGKPDAMPKWSVGSRGGVQCLQVAAQSRGRSASASLA